MDSSKSGTCQSWLIRRCGLDAGVEKGIENGRLDAMASMPHSGRRVIRDKRHPLWRDPSRSESRPDELVQNAHRSDALSALRDAQHEANPASDARGQGNLALMKRKREV